MGSLSNNCPRNITNIIIRNGKVVIREHLREFRHATQWGDPGECNQIGINEYEHSFADHIVVKNLSSSLSIEEGAHIMPVFAYYLLIKAANERVNLEQLNTAFFIITLVTPFDEFYLLGKLAKHSIKGAKSVRFTKLKQLSTEQKMVLKATDEAKFANNLENAKKFARFEVQGAGSDLLSYINSLINKNIRNAILELPESRVVAQKYFNRINENPANYLSDYTVHLNDFDTWYANVFKSELFEAHHIIPKNVLRDNTNLQSILDWARNNGKTWDFGDIDNGIMLQKRRKNYIGEVVGDHANHPEYDRQIREKINQIFTENSGNLSDAYDDFVEFLNDLKQQINTEVVEGNLIINTITIP